MEEGTGLVQQAIQFGCNFFDERVTVHEKANGDYIVLVAGEVNNEVFNVKADQIADFLANLGSKIALAFLNGLTKEKEEPKRLYATLQHNAEEANIKWPARREKRKRAKVAALK